MRLIRITQFLLAAALSNLALGCEQGSKEDEDPLAAKVGAACTLPTFSEDKVAESVQEPEYMLSNMPGEQCEVEGTTSGCLGKIAQPFPEGTPRWNFFCTCRCADSSGNDHAVDESLCECPGDSVCVEVFAPMEGVPEDVTGSYCIPRCIAEDECPQACESNEQDDPEWDWICKENS